MNLIEVMYSYSLSLYGKSSFLSNLLLYPSDFVCIDWDYMTRGFGYLSIELLYLCNWNPWIICFWSRLFSSKISILILLLIVLAKMKSLPLWGASILSLYQLVTQLLPYLVYLISILGHLDLIGSIDFL